jgi:hypothetical protein
MPMLMISKFILFLNALLSITIIFIPISSSHIFALSPTFPRQETKDEPVDWIDMSTQDRTITGNRYTDIRRVNYFSDGNILNATLWIKAGPDRISSNYENVVSYGMYIDADSDRETGWGGVDYQMEVAWQNEMWIRRLIEWSSLGDARVLNIQYPYTGFSEEMGNYVLLTLDLDDIVFPDKYKVIFYAGEKEENSSISKIDFTNWVHIPPPELVVSTEPSSVDLRHGEIETITVHVNSTTGFEPVVYLSAVNQSGIEWKFKLDELHIPSYGMESTSLQIKALENADSRPYMLNILANATFPSESLIETRSPVEAMSVLPKKIGIENTTEQATLMINVQAPLTIQETITNFWNTFGEPMNFVYVVAAGITPWIFIKIREKLKKNKKRRLHD